MQGIRRTDSSVNDIVEHDNSILSCIELVNAKDTFLIKVSFRTSVAIIASSIVRAYELIEDRISYVPSRVGHA